jgi:transposase
MDASYQEFFTDIQHYRALGASEASLQRSEGLLNLVFFLFSEFDGLQQKIERQQAQVLRLQEMQFGSGRTIDGVGEPVTGAAATEAVAEKPAATDQAPDQDKPPPAAALTPEVPQKPRKPVKGHGRLKATDYTGAEVIHCPHHLRPGDVCPECHRGKVYAVDPAQRIVFTGQAPLLATRYELERLRCALCSAYFTASAAVDTRAKYTPSAKSMLAILHGRMGTTYYGLAQLQANLGMPLPLSTQCQVIESMMGPLYAIEMQLAIRAANGNLLCQDDTWVRILTLMKENQVLDPERRGMYTSAFVSGGEHPIVLFLSGRQHAGENFDDLMLQREAAEPLTRMADALSANRKHRVAAINAKCNAHAFRRFRSIAALFPEVCGTVMDLYAQVYEHEAHCVEHALDDSARLAYHQRHSEPLMNRLHQVVTKAVGEYEPNGALGGELRYVLTHWPELTQFLKIAGAPLDNNSCERLLKIVIKYRKNSLFFGTAYSASYLSTLMSVIATAQLNHANVLQYLTVLQEHEAAVWRAPGDWLPWNYHAALSQATARQSAAMAA